MLPEKTIELIEEHFHKLILERAGDLIKEKGIELPGLLDFVKSGENRGWFPVPGMFGGFAYHFEGDKLVCESSSRIVDGSGQRHEITPKGAELVWEEGAGDGIHFEGQDGV